MYLALLMIVPFVILTFYQIISKKPGSTWRKKLARILLLIPICIVFPLGIFLALMVCVRGLTGKLDYTSHQEQSNINSVASQIAKSMKSNPNVDLNAVKDLLKNKFDKPKKPKKIKPINRFEMMDIDKGK